MRRHAPAFEPDPAEYVSWEYCRGYSDAAIRRMLGYNFERVIREHLDWARLGPANPKA